MFKQVQEGELLWTPSEERRQRSRLKHYQEWLQGERGLSFQSYHELHAWSVSDIEGFWQSIADYFQVKWASAPARVLSSRSMPGARWFEGGQLNFAEHAMGGGSDALALIATSETGTRETLSYGELGRAVARTQAALMELGVGKGDRVAALLPNGIPAVVLFLATAGLGAIWTSSAPEFGVGAVLDRFTQVAPKVLCVVDGYRYGGKDFSRVQMIEEVASALPTLEALIWCENLELPLPKRLGGHEPIRFRSWLEGSAAEAEPKLHFTPVPFEHPLWILYSSGTTGLPKPIVHGHGGILLELYKALALHCDLGEGDRFFWFSTTGWMMWNFLVGGLLTRSSLVLYDGSPGYPNLSRLWQLAEEERITVFGTSAPFIQACQKAGLHPGRDSDLSSIETLGTTGSPLPVDGFGWVYDHLGKQAPADVLLASVSGGTDVCTAFAICCPELPVYAGELQCSALGAKIEAYDPAGEPVIGEVGELVLTEPMPSMPIFFWGDNEGERLFESYFSTYPGAWRHGDWVKINERGGLTIYGRSDATLNRGGVRMGTSEFYRVVEAHPRVLDSLVVDTTLPSDTKGKLYLFVVLRAQEELDPALEAELKKAIVSELSPRHLPDRLLVIPEVPRTLSGKKIEVPIKKILLGVPPEKSVGKDTLKNPAALDFFVKLRASELLP